MLFYTSSISHLKNVLLLLHQTFHQTFLQSFYHFTTVPPNLHATHCKYDLNKYLLFFHVDMKCVKEGGALFCDTNISVWDLI